MTSVWVVLTSDWFHDRPELVGVFASQERAERAAEVIEAAAPTLTAIVEEWELES